MKQILILFFLFAVLSVQTGFCQIKYVKIATNKGISVEDFQVGEVKRPVQNISLVSFKIGEQVYFSSDKKSYEKLIQMN